MHVDFAKKHKRLHENHDTSILHLNTEIDNVRAYLNETNTTVSALSSDVVSLQVETRQLSGEKREEDISHFTAQLHENGVILEQFRSSFDNKLNGIAQF
jgi:capsule polysaccharide export protein KpsE/RkpR